MAYISSNHVYILFVCASAVISLECETQERKTVYLISVYNLYYHLQPRANS